MEEFLEELIELTNRYGIGLGGCGCCGSPFLYDLESGVIIGTDLGLGEDLNSYDVEINLANNTKGKLQ